MPTVIGVFSDNQVYETVLEELVGHGVDAEAIAVAWREKTVRQVEDLEVVTYVDHFEGPAAEAGKGALGGVVGGATAGAGTVLLAAAGIALGPEVAVMLGTGTIAAAATAAAAGAAAGGVAGSAIGALLGAADHDATKVTTTEVLERNLTESDGFVVSVEAEVEEVDTVIGAVEDAGASDIAVVRGQGIQMRFTPVKRSKGK